MHCDTKALKSCVNIVGVALVQNITVLTDACIDSQFEVVFDVLEVELNKSASLETVFNGDFITFSSNLLLQSLDNQIWKDALLKKTN